MWGFTNAVQRDEMAIACTGHAHLVTCERYERSGEEAFTAKADSERSAKSEIGAPKVRSQSATLTCTKSKRTEAPIFLLIFLSQTHQIFKNKKQKSYI